MPNNHARITAALALTVASLVAGAPARATITPIGPSPTMPTPSPTMPRRFDGLPISATTVNHLRALQGETRTALNWSPCVRGDLDGHAVGTIDHCVAFSMGLDSHPWVGGGAITYLVSDTACPKITASLSLGTGAAAPCYGGYLIAGVVDGATSTSMLGGTSTATSTARIRIGVQRPVPLSSPPRTLVELPVTPKLVVTQTAVFAGAPASAHVVIKDAAGAVLYDVTSYPSTSIAVTGAGGGGGGGGGVDCDDVGEGAQYLGAFAGEVAAESLAAGIVMGGVLVGAEVAGVGSVASLGSLSPLAVGAGTAVGGTAIALAGLVYTMASARAEAVANLSGFLARTSCELLSSFTGSANDIDHDPQTPQYQSSGASGNQMDGWPEDDDDAECDDVETTVDYTACTTTTTTAYIDDDGECKHTVVVVHTC